MSRLEPLKPGDVICDQCNGTGKPGNNKIDYDNRMVVPWHCDKCSGTGKFDWIENIVGKKPRVLSANWTMEMDQDLSTLYGTNLHDYLIDAISKSMAEKIDKEIMKGFTNGIKSWGSDM
jgi:hypothetical protein